MWCRSCIYAHRCRGCSWLVVFRVLSVVCLRGFYALLLGVSFVSYSIGCCLFLLGGALRFCGFIYLVSGFSWYLVLFCLVYVGGVYVLLVYISMFNSKFFV